MMPMGGMRPNPMMMRAAALRGGPAPQPVAPMAQPSGGLPGLGGLMGQAPGPQQMPLPNQNMPPMPVSRPQMPGPMAPPSQNLWSGGQRY